jgi:hypothetical protein
LNELEVLVRAYLRGALKEHVLEEVSEARAPGALVGGAHVIPEVHRDNGCGVILGERNEESVSEPVCIYRYAHGGKLCTMTGMEEW